MSQDGKKPRRRPRFVEVSHERFELLRWEPGAHRVDRNGNRLPPPEVELPPSKPGRPRLWRGLAWALIAVVGLFCGLSLLLGH